MKKAFLAVFLACIMLLSACPVAGASEVGDISEGSVVFGAYPSERVTDEGTLRALGALVADFDSDERAVKRVDGGYMKYIDLSYNGEDYRAVKFISYRPARSDENRTAENSAQDENGYYPGEIYFFKYTGIVWDILDKDEGLVISRNILDAESFNEDFYVLESGVWSDLSFEFPNYYANSYMFSGLDGFLNDSSVPCSFINTAFDGDQLSRLGMMKVDNSDSMENKNERYYPDFCYSARVKALSASEVNNYFASHGSSTLNMEVTDYAKCMGLSVNYENKAGFWTSSRWLSAPPAGTLGSFSKFAVYAPASGASAGANAVAVNTLSGVRPVIKIEGDFDITEVPIKFSSVPVAGDVPSALFQKVVPEGHYTVSSVIWSINGSSFTSLIPTFNKGNSYTARLTLKADEGWTFAENAAVYSEGCSVKPDSVEIEKNLIYVYYTFAIPELDPVRAALLTVDRPVIDSVIADTSVLEGEDLIKTAVWQRYYPLTKIWVTPKDGAVFSEGIYRLTVSLTPKAGKYLTEDFNMTVNALRLPSDGPFVTVENEKITVQVYYELTSSLSLVTLFGETQPAAGEAAAQHSGEPNSPQEGDIVFDTENGSFWYEGSRAVSPEALSADSVFETGKVYTYRYVVYPAEGFSFASSAAFENGLYPGKQPSYILKNEDGSYTVDFTYSLVDERIGEVAVSGISLPYAGVDYKAGRTVVSDGAAYELNAESGWYDADGNIALPEVGQIYCAKLVLFAKTGFCFSDLPEFVLTDGNGDAIAPVSVDYETGAFGRENDILTVYIALNCSDGRVPFVKISGLEVPSLGEALDYTAQSVKDDVNVVYIDYLINGERPQKAYVPAQGDKIEIYIGAAVSEEYVKAGYSFDGDVSMTLWEDIPEGQAKTAFLAEKNVSIFKFSYTVSYVEYSVTVDGGRASSSKAIFGTVVTVTAVPPEGMVFSRWNIVEGDIVLSDALSERAIFTMPFSDVVLEAVYKPENANSTAPSSDDEFEITLGDVNFDGKITAEDARLALRRAVKLEDYKEGSDEFIACDVTRDKQVTAEDARLILRAAVNLENPAKW